MGFRAGDVVRVKDSDYALSANGAPIGSTLVVQKVEQKGSYTYMYFDEPVGGGWHPEHFELVPDTLTASKTAEANARGEGYKADENKPDWSLLDLDVIEDVVHVLTVGAKKYSRDNWQKVPNARERYFAAALRHLTAWQRGEANDPETGLPHLAHAQCCLTFLSWLEKHT